MQKSMNKIGMNANNNDDDLTDLGANQILLNWVNDTLQSRKLPLITNLGKGFDVRIIII